MIIHEQETIIILDFGDAESHKTARQIRELKVFSVILPFTTALADIAAKDAKGIVFSRGNSQENLTCDPGVYKL
ncbi:MAG: GMP synthase (glutamine-hydrolyzing), partial [Peptococcaceae bacterium]|nr:GMP synthase (glutamine-hydrolyzing) [Peptococcaceae bacterium]